MKFCKLLLCFYSLIFLFSISVCCQQAMNGSQNVAMLKSLHIINTIPKSTPVNYSQLQEDNRPMPSIERIFQTKDHIIWIGTTDEGLIEYNGSSFIHYRANSNDSFGLPSNIIKNIYEEDIYTLWISTETALCKFDRIKKHFTTLNLDNKILSGDGFLKLPDGKLICGTSEGLCFISRKNNKLVPLPDQKIKNPAGVFFNGESIQHTGNLIYDKAGKIWSHIITQNLEGLAAFDLKKNDWTLYPQQNIYPQLKTATHYKPEQITTWTILPDQDGERLWAGGYGTGLRCFYKTTGQWKQFYFQKKGSPQEWVNAITTISQKSNNELWIGTYEGMELFNTTTFKAYSYFDNKKFTNARGESTVFNLMPDHCGNLWIGGSLGIYRLHALNNRFATDQMLQSDSALNISAALQFDNGNILIANYLPVFESRHQNNLMEFRDNLLVSQYNFPDHNEGPFFPIRKIEMNSEGKIFLFSGTGIKVEDHTSRAIKPLPITLITTNGKLENFKCDFGSVVKWDDSIYYGCKRTTSELGFIKINLKTKTAIQYKAGETINPHEPISNSIHFLYKDFYNRLWCCSDDRGLSIFTPSTQAFEHYYAYANNKNSLPSNLIRSVYQTSDSTYWISTNAGLCKTKAVPGTGAIFTIVIPDVECNFIADDGKGYLWINSKQGNYRLNIKTGTWQLFGKEDGYYWDAYNAKKYLLKDGSLLMADGQIINPERIPFNIYKPNSFLGGVQIFNNDYKSDTAFPLKKTLRLKNYQNFISINYSCDSYINEEQNSYAYKLAGVDTGWVQAGVRTTAFYTQLPPGRYNFFVKASNNDGVQGPAMQLLNIIITPAWYQTWWFKVISLAILFALVFLFYKQRIKEEKAKGLAKSSAAELKQVKAEFEKQIAETETIALRAQMNPHFIFNVLNSINKYILVNDGERASHYLTQFSRLIRQVLENSKSPKVPLEADLQALNIYIDLEKLRFGDKFTCALKVDEKIDQQFIQLPPLLIQPYAENAIWHGLMQKDESGHLEITVTQEEENMLKVTIEDNGIGRTKAMEIKSKSATKHKSFGMQITRDRIAIVNRLFNMQASIDFEDLYENGIASGTRVILNIPV